MFTKVADTNNSEIVDNITQSFKKYFFSSDPSSFQKYEERIGLIASKISSQLSNQNTPYSGKNPQELKEELSKIVFFPEKESTFESVLENLNDLVLQNNISVYHPNCLAHLHCPTFITSLVAEMLISAFNQSMDSWDQAPAATMIEQAFCDELCKIYGFDSKADAVFTGGGTMSNFMGMLLARDYFSASNYDWNIQKNGLPPESHKFRIICTEFSHFTITQSASILGLGEKAIVKIETNDFIEESEALEIKIEELKSQGLIPIAFVTTAGTTDFGTISDIKKLAEITNKHRIWLHIDAAFGGALIFSNKYKQKLDGLASADSVTIDFHKLFYQPISCGVFILKNKENFNYIRLHADYLNPESNEQLGMIDLVSKSIQTTRRFDALKPFMALQNVGTKRFGEMIDYTIDLASTVSNILGSDSKFELATQSHLNTVVFRYLPTKTALADEINNAIKTKLLLSGEAIIGQTSLNNKAFLKFTLLNPTTSIEDIEKLIIRIKEIGDNLDFDA